MDFSGVFATGVRRATARKEPKWNYEADDNHICAAQQALLTGFKT
jgi:hypothetical protein